MRAQGRKCCSEHVEMCKGGREGGGEGEKMSMRGVPPGDRRNGSERQAGHVRKSTPEAGSITRASTSSPLNEWSTTVLALDSLPVSRLQLHSSDAGPAAISLRAMISIASSRKSPKSKGR
ncbi:hypothetical protein BaRGS_00000628, partial [Batillaria attramentaria]